MKYFLIGLLCAGVVFLLVSAFLPSDYEIERELVIAAVTKNGDALRYASEDLRLDRGIVLMVMRSSRGETDSWRDDL